MAWLLSSHHCETIWIFIRNWLKFQFCFSGFKEEHGHYFRNPSKKVGYCGLTFDFFHCPSLLTLLGEGEETNLNYLEELHSRWITKVSFQWSFAWILLFHSFWFSTISTSTRMHFNLCTVFLSLFSSLLSFALLFFLLEQS